MSVSEVDRQMRDWRDTQMTQANPNKLGKILRSLDWIKGLISPEDSVLDVGCGRGFVYEYLGHKNYKGIDLSADEIEIAVNSWPGVDFSVGDLFSIEGTWDVVLCSRVLLHVAPLEDAIRKLMDASRKRLILIAAISTEDTVEEHWQDSRRAYFRRISRNTLDSFGKNLVHDIGAYSVVVYDR